MSRIIILSIALSLASQFGCRSPYYADKGAAFGGLTGAGVGALVGEATGNNPLAGAAIGGGVGTMLGAATGEALDDIEARNQAMIQQQLGRQLAGATTLDDAIAMSQAGLSDEVITQHLRTHGLARTLDPADLISLKQQGVSDRVLRAMQDASAGQYPVAQSSATVPANTPVIVEEHYYGRPVHHPHLWYHHRHPRHYRHARRHGPGVRWGFSFSN